MCAGFFWRVPNKDGCFLYTDLKTDKRMSVDFSGPVKSTALSEWQTVSLSDRLSLAALLQEFKEISQD